MASDEEGVAHAVPPLKTQPAPTETPRISAQLVGAYGERVVEAELLRRGWLASNVNASIKNAADFDVFAMKGSRIVQLRVKTCGPGMNAFQFGFRSATVLSNQVSVRDFTVLVSMGSARADDRFYILPTRQVREVISRYKHAYLAQLRRDGLPRKDTGHWTLHLDRLRNGEDRPNYGLAEKWAPFLDRWEALESERSLIE